MIEKDGFNYVKVPAPNDVVLECEECGDEISCNDDYYYIRVEDATYVCRCCVDGE